MIAAPSSNAGLRPACRVDALEVERAAIAEQHAGDEHVDATVLVVVERLRALGPGVVDALVPVVAAVGAAVGERQRERGLRAQLEVGGRRGTAIAQQPRLPARRRGDAVALGDLRAQVVARVSRQVQVEVTVVVEVRGEDRLAPPRERRQAVEPRRELEAPIGVTPVDLRAIARLARAPVGVGGKVEVAVVVEVHHAQIAHAADAAVGIAEHRCEPHARRRKRRHVRAPIGQSRDLEPAVAVGVDDVRRVRRVGEESRRETKRLCVRREGGRRERKQSGDGSERTRHLIPQARPP